MEEEKKQPQIASLHVAQSCQQTATVVADFFVFDASGEGRGCDIWGSPKQICVPRHVSVPIPLELSAESIPTTVLTSALALGF
jgi:hypothetical protein